MKVNHSETIKTVPEYAKVLKTIRENKKITQRELAKHLKVSHMQVSHLETGKRFPRVDVLDDWCKFLNYELVIELSSRPSLNKKPK